MTVPSPHEAARRALQRASVRDPQPAGTAWNADTWFAHVPAIAYIRRFARDDLPGSAHLAFIDEKIGSVLGHAASTLVDEAGLWTSLVHPDDLGQVLATWRRTTEPGQRYRLTYRLAARDGTVVNVLDEAAVAEDAVTGTRAWYGVLVDVGADTLSPDLREAEEKYRRLIEQIPAVTYIDEVPEDDPSDLSPLYISPQIERLLGYTPDEWVRDPDLWSRVTHPDDLDTTEASAVRSFETGTPLSIEYRMIARDGRTVWIREEASLFRDEHGAPKFWQGVYVDITDLKRAEEELNNALARERDASERLRALDEMKNTFLQAVSHDLRTPLAAILGLAVTLERDDLSLDDRDVHDMAGRIATNSRKLDRMVADLLDLDRLSRGIIEPKLQRADVGAIVRAMVEHSELTEGRSVDLDIGSVSIPVDASKLERIVENLVANAVRHTPKDANVWIRIRAHEGGALISVDDDGPGVPPELHEAVFEPFRQGPSASDHSPGAGVGLALVARFAQLHGGRAWVEDRPDGGASFRVFLPGAAAG